MINFEFEENDVKNYERKNFLELESLEKIILLFEDIKSNETNNIEYGKDIIKEMSFSSESALGKIGDFIKDFFMQYYDLKKKLTQNITKILKLLKSKSFFKLNTDKDNDFSDFEMIGQIKSYESYVESIDINKYLCNNDLKEIIESISSLNNLKQEYLNSDASIEESLKKLQDINIDELTQFKQFKKLKTNLENQLKDICEKGTESQYLDEFITTIQNDNSEQQVQANWTVSYLNKCRSILSTISEKVYEAFKKIFKILFTKFIEKQLYKSVDLCIILIQTFSKKNANQNILLEEEFNSDEIFQNEELWKSLLYQKLNEVMKRVKEEGTKNEEEENTYIKDNLEPTFVSFIFSMKDFNIDKSIQDKIIEDYKNNDKYKKYDIDVNMYLS